MLRRALDKYREEAKARQARVLEVEEEKSMILYKARLASPQGEMEGLLGTKNGDDKVKVKQQKLVELELTASRSTMQVESLKAENEELRGEKLTLARRASRAVDSERSTSAALSIERRRTSQVSEGVERRTREARGDTVLTSQTSSPSLAAAFFRARARQADHRRPREGGASPER